MAHIINIIFPDVLAMKLPDHHYTPKCYVEAYIPYYMVVASHLIRQIYNLRHANKVNEN